jgi:RNase P subunit RPR2
MYTLIPGHWYLRYTCKKCQATQILFPDLSRGTAEINAEYVVTCVHCKLKSHYDSDEVERYQHPLQTPETV